MIRLALFLFSLVPQPVSQVQGVAWCAPHSRDAERIALREGFFVAGALPARLHNPGALVFVGQTAAVLGPRLFARFPDDSTGWAALERDLAAKRRKGVRFKIAWGWMK